MLELKMLFNKLFNKLASVTHSTPYRYDRTIGGHEVWVLRVERTNDMTALYVIVDDNGTNRYGLIIEPHDTSEPITIDIEDSPRVVLTRS